MCSSCRKLTEEAGMNGHGGDALSHSDHAEIDDLLVQARAVAMDIRNSISFIRKDGVDSTSLSGMYAHRNKHTHTHTHTFYNPTICVFVFIHFYIIINSLQYYY